MAQPRLGLHQSQGILEGLKKRQKALLEHETKVNSSQPSKWKSTWEAGILFRIISQGGKCCRADQQGQEFWCEDSQPSFLQFPPSSAAGPALGIRSKRAPKCSLKGCRESLPAALGLRGIFFISSTTEIPPSIEPQPPLPAEESSLPVLTRNSAYAEIKNISAFLEQR